MAAFALPMSHHAAVLTENLFEARTEPTTASLAALTSPIERAFVFPSKGKKYRFVVTTLQKSTPAWVEPTMSALIEIQELPDNWDSYGGKRIDPDLILQSLSILQQIMEIDTPPPSVVPLGDGGLQFEWHRRQQDLEIVIAATEPARFFYQNRTNSILEEGFASEILRLVSFLRGIA